MLTCAVPLVLSDFIGTPCLFQLVILFFSFLSTRCTAKDLTNRFQLPVYSQKKTRIQWNNQDFDIIIYLACVRSGVQGNHLVQSYYEELAQPNLIPLGPNCSFQEDYNSLNGQVILAELGSRWPPRHNSRLIKVPGQMLVSIINMFELICNYFAFFKGTLNIKYQ